MPHSDLSSEDEEEISEDTLSLETASETSSIASMGKQAILEEIFEEAPPTYVEALWDHVTLDPEELGFRAGDVVEVTDMNDKDWWWGKLDDREGWFPATFVRLRANQEVTADDFAQKVKDGALDSQTVLRRYSTNLLSKDQARTNVVNEIMQAEREYVKRLKDVVEGYVEKARKRPEMFPDERLWKIFSNIEDIYRFSCMLLKDLESHFVSEAPQLSRIGEIFLKHKHGFEIYSEYCNNHPQACEELKSIQKNKKYMHFFEACRLLQQMIQIPLEGFLLTPVQKICKYPLQLAELLKYTRPEHPDHNNLNVALKTMKSIAMLINERKRKMESIEKLAEWQDRVQDWEGPALLEQSSELIYSGELTKVNSSGWAQDRVFFIFDHQLVYCKKDLLWRDVMIYKGRIDLDSCDIVWVKDGKDSQFNVNVKNAFKVYDHQKEKWYLMYARSPEERDKWLKAFDSERQRVMQDNANGFSLSEYRQKVSGGYARFADHPDADDKVAKRKLSRMSYQHAVMKNIPAHVTLPRAISSRESLMYKHPHKKKGWFPFGGRKSKR
jgi:Rho guanine nucleotide exchange factor 4